MWHAHATIPDRWANPGKGSRRANVATIALGFGRRTMSERKQPTPGFVVLRHLGGDRWQMLGEVQRKPGLSARAARSRAILDATDGAARPDEVYAAVLRSEWRVSLDREHPSA